MLDRYLERILSFDDRYKFNNVPKYFEGYPDYVQNEYSQLLSATPRVLDAYNFDELVRLGLEGSN